MIINFFLIVSSHDQRHTVELKGVDEDYFFKGRGLMYLGNNYFYYDLFIY
jgi:hypothetical protein